MVCICNVLQRAFAKSLIASMWYHWEAVDTWDSGLSRKSRSLVSWFSRTLSPPLLSPLLPFLPSLLYFLWTYFLLPWGSRLPLPHPPAMTNSFTTGQETVQLAHGLKLWIKINLFPFKLFILKYFVAVTKRWYRQTLKKISSQTCSIQPPDLVLISASQSDCGN